MCIIIIIIMLMVMYKNVKCNNFGNSSFNKTLAKNDAKLQLKPMNPRVKLYLANMFKFNQIYHGMPYILHIRQYSCNNY